MTLLCITPDYASHYMPLAALARLYRSTGEDVVVATGPALRPRVLSDGFSHAELILARSSNPDLMRPESLDQDARVHLQANVDATRSGMVETLRYQAEGRRADLLWNPLGVAARLEALLREIRPRHVLTVQLSSNATLALFGLRTRFATFVTGHPAQIPGLGELYGFPHVRPARFDASPEDLSTLAMLCKDVQETFTEEFNTVLNQLDARAARVTNALAASSPWLVLHNYPEELGAYRRPFLPPQARYVGPVVRSEELDPASESWLRDTQTAHPTVLVAFGSFFSLRDDVLRRVVDALRNLPHRVLFAAGVADPVSLGIPDRWYVRDYVPQAGLIKHCDLIISHGGNNTVQEALSAGVPLLLAPFSSDQFSGAADVERHRLGAVFDPNRSPSAEIRSLVGSALEARERTRQLGLRLASAPGILIAKRAMDRAFQG